MVEVAAAGRKGARAAQLGILVNALLAVAKLIAGLVGNSFALVADAIESTADIVSSAIVWSGLRVASREPDEVYPFGYGKAESLAAAAVALMIIGAALAIAIAAVDGILAPHETPAAWTLAVLVGVVLIKWLMARYVDLVGRDIGSGAVRADAWHHRSDAITSAAAFVGIALAVAGGPGWQSADDWAALVASLVILYNGIAVLRPAINDLMDRTPEAMVVSTIDDAARSVPGVLLTEKLAVRRAGLAYRATIHVQADAGMTLQEAHELSGRVKGAIKSAVPRVQQVLVHMEPFEEDRR